MKANPDVGTNDTFKEIVHSNLKADNKKIHISHSRFLGKGPKAPLLVTLGSVSEKYYLQSKYKFLKGSSLSITDDLTPKQLKVRKQLLAKRREFIDNGTAKKVHVYDYAIQADEDWYDLKDDGTMTKELKANMHLQIVPDPTNNDAIPHEDSAALAKLMKSL